MKPQAQRKVLLLTSARPNKWLDDTSDEVSRRLHQFVDLLNNDENVVFSVTTLNNLEFTISDEGVSIFDSYTGEDLSAYDLVHFRNVSLYFDYARAITLYLKHKGKEIFEAVDTEAIPEYGKLSQMVLFALNGVKVPHTWSTWTPADIPNLVKKAHIPYPLILKANDGIKGRDNFLIRDEAHLDEIVATYPKIQFVVQPFIPNNGDYRILYQGKSDPLIFKRIAAEGSHLNNTAQGGASEEVVAETFDKDVLAMAQKAAELTRRKLAGVDVIQDNETGKWAILEVNGNPALSSGVLPKAKAIAYKKMIEEIL